MPHHEDLAKACRLIGLRLKNLADLRCRGVISERLFVDTLLTVEAEQIGPGGFNLTASNTLDNWTVLEIKMKGTGETCAAFEFLPETGEFRKVGGDCETAS